MTQANRPVTYANVPSHYGHDSFLVETAKVGAFCAAFWLTDSEG